MERSKSKMDEALNGAAQSDHDNNYTDLYEILKDFSSKNKDHPGSR